MEERLRLNLESRFSSFEERMPSVLADLLKQKWTEETVSDGNTSVGCRIPISTARRKSRISTLGTNN